jgi:hypothetical protein
VSRFALHRQGQNSQVCPRCRARSCRGLTLVDPIGAGRGYHRAGLNGQGSTDGRNGLPLALGERVYHPRSPITWAQAGRRP